MPITAITSRAIEHPEIPYDKLRYSVQINTSIDRASGRLKAAGTLTVVRSRVLPPGAGSSDPRWEDDPNGQPVAQVIPDLFAAAAQDATMAAAMAALTEAVAAYNAAKHLV